MKEESAIVLLSGGLDSVAALAWALDRGYSIRKTVTYIYGQRHSREVDSAHAIAEHYGVPNECVSLPLIRGSQLTDGRQVPLGRDLSTIEEDTAPTYVPNRNMILIAYAAANAFSGDAVNLVGGWNATDGSAYPDCRDEFLAATERSLRLATLRPFNIVRPLIGDRKTDIVRLALDLRTPIHLTWTCYLGEEYACGFCDACQLRVDAFRHVGVIDPVPYGVDIDWVDCEPYRTDCVSNPGLERGR